MRRVHQMRGGAAGPLKLVKRASSAVVGALSMSAVREARFQPTPLAPFGLHSHKARPFESRVWQGLDSLDEESYDSCASGEPSFTSGQSEVGCGIGIGIGDVALTSSSGTSIASA